MSKILNEEIEELIIDLRSHLFEQYPTAHGFKLFINEDYIDVEVGEYNGDLITIHSHIEKSKPNEAL